ncbi:MAG: DUF1893 domain-containing protein [Ruminococcaceae bacterium]|nr:DUF1893 domain-containing protein [Oscillospiraceae bacterium]
MSCIEKARNILENTGCTCVFCNGQTVLTDSRRGVRPLLDLLENKMDMTTYDAADKVVGKAAAYLYCLLKIRSLYAAIISRSALAVLEKYHIPVSYGTLVPAIRNRRNDGPCPMEHAVWEIDDPAEALQAIYKTLESLKP